MPDGARRLTRHALADRLLHWCMAIGTLILLGTAFLPILGIEFAWVTIHWVSGIALTVFLIAHTVRAAFWQDWGPCGSTRRICAMPCNWRVGTSG